MLKNHLPEFVFGHHNKHDRDSEVDVLINQITKLVFF